MRRGVGKPIYQQVAQGLVPPQNFGFFNHGANSMVPSLLESDGLHLSSKGKATVAVWVPQTLPLVEKNKILLVAPIL